MSGGRADAADASAASAGPAEANASFAPLSAGADDAAAPNDPSLASNGRQEGELSTGDASANSTSETADAEPTAEPPSAETEPEAATESRYDEDEETESEMELEIDEVDEEAEQPRQPAPQLSVPTEPLEESRPEPDAAPISTETTQGHTRDSGVPAPTEAEAKQAEPEDEEEEDEAFPPQLVVRADESKATQEVAAAKEASPAKEVEEKKPEQESVQQRKRGDRDKGDEEDRSTVRSLTMVEEKADGELLRVLGVEASRMAEADRKLVVWNDIAKRFSRRFKAGRNVQARVAWLQLVSRDKDHREYGKLTDEMKKHIETYATAMSKAKSPHVTSKKRPDIVPADPPRPMKTARVEQTATLKSPAKSTMKSQVKSSIQSPVKSPTKETLSIPRSPKETTPVTRFPPAPLNLQTATLDAAIEELTMPIALKYAPEFNTTERAKVWDMIARASPGRYESGRQAKHHVMWLVNLLEDPGNPEHKKVTPALRKVMNDLFGKVKNDKPAKSEKPLQTGEAVQGTSEKQVVKSPQRGTPLPTPNKKVATNHPSPKRDAKKGRPEHPSPKRGDVAPNGTPKKQGRFKVRPTSDNMLALLALAEHPYTASTSSASAIWTKIARTLGAVHPDVHDSHSASQRFNTLMKVFNDSNHPNHEDLSVSLMAKLNDYDQNMKSYRAKVRVLKDKAETNDSSNESSDERASPEDVSKSKGVTSVQAKAGNEVSLPVLAASPTQPSTPMTDSSRTGGNSSHLSASKMNTPNPGAETTEMLSVQPTPPAQVAASSGQSSTTPSNTLASKPGSAENSTTKSNDSSSTSSFPSKAESEQSGKLSTAPKQPPGVAIDQVPGGEKSMKSLPAIAEKSAQHHVAWLGQGTKKPPLPLDAEADESLMRAMVDIQPWKADRLEKSEAWMKVVNAVNDKNSRIRNGVSVMGRVKWLQRVLDTPGHEDHPKLTHRLRELITEYTSMYNSYRSGSHPHPVSIKKRGDSSEEEFVAPTEQKKRKAPGSVDSSGKESGGTPKAKRVATPRDSLIVKTEAIASSVKKNYPGSGTKTPAALDTNGHDVLLREALRARPFHGGGGEGMGAWDKVATSADRILGLPIYKTGVHAMKRIQRLLAAFRSRGETSDIRLTAGQSEMLALIDSMLKVKWPGLDKRLTDEHKDLIARAEELVNGTASADNVSVEALKVAINPDSATVEVAPTAPTADDVPVEEDEEPEMRIVIRSEEERRQLKIQAKLRKKLELAETTRRELEAELDARKGLEAEVKLRLEQVNALQDEVIKLRTAAASDRAAFEAQTKSLLTELASYNLALGKQTTKLEQEREEHREELRSIVELLKTEREMHERDTRTLLEVVHREREDRREEFVAMMNLVTRSVLQGELASGE